MSFHPGCGARTDTKWNALLARYRAGWMHIRRDYHGSFDYWIFLPPASVTTSHLSYGCLLIGDIFHEKIFAPPSSAKEHRVLRYPTRERLRGAASKDGSTAVVLRSFRTR